MTAAERQFLSTALAGALYDVERRRAKKPSLREQARCVFCGQPITADRFYVIREGGGYAAGCLHCGAMRESFPSVNPFMFSNLARSRTN